MSNRELFSIVAEWVRENYPGDAPAEVTITTTRGQKAKLPVPANCQAQRPRRSHSADFRTVGWDGERYDLTPTQAAAVKVLWEAMESGSPAMSQAAVLEAADSTADRLRDVFRESAAWGDLIVSAGKGLYKLAD